MLEECDLIGSGLVADWRERLSNHFAVHMELGTTEWIVAADGDRIVGTGCVFVRTDGAHIQLDVQAALAGVYVLPGYRRAGIARTIAERAIAWARSRGCVRVRLYASAQGRPLYESLGFTTTTEMALELR